MSTARFESNYNWKAISLVPEKKQMALSRSRTRHTVLEEESTSKNSKNKALNKNKALQKSRLANGENERPL